MSDIFDDIDEILSSAEETEATAVAGAESENFNEAELQDIMSEIESLEKEFEDGESMEVAAMIQDAVMEEINAELKKETDPRPSLQDEIERELESINAKSGDPEEVSPVIIAPVITAKVEVEKVAAVLSFEKPAPKAVVTPVTETATTPAMAATSGVSFAAQGSMALTLDFKVGSENAKLTIDPVKGLTVVLSGVELTINETDGCHVTMDNGMKFTVPLSTLEKSQKKSA
jgi:hypothetical protein